MADKTTITALTVKQHNAIAALMVQPTVRKAAEVAEVPERTLYKWLKSPLFVEEYRAARREATSQAIARLQQVSGAAVSELLRLATQARSEAVRLGAVCKILDLAIKSVELDDLAARLTALEERYAEKL
jgi:hypothetical protein